MKTKFLIAMFLAAGLSMPRAQSCDCIPPPPPKEALNSSDAVFTGKVESIKKVRLKLGQGYIASWNEVVFQVSESWKGSSVATMTVYTDNITNCGFRFAIGSDYLVYANQTKPALSDHGVLTTDICTRTALLSKALHDREVIGPGTKPNVK